MAFLFQEALMPTSEYIRKRALLEDQIPLEQMTPDQIRRKDARDRKRAQRELEKQAKAKKEAAQKEEVGAKTIQEWWEIQRKKLSPEEREKFEARQDEVLEMVEVMDEYVKPGLEGSRTTQKDLDDTIEEVREMAKAGLVTTAMLVVPKLWTKEEADLRRRIIATGEQNAIFLRYGYITGIPERAFEDFRQKFMVPRTSSAIQKPGGSNP